MSRTMRMIIIATMLLALFLSSCAQKTDQPASAVEAYWKAMAAKDGAGLSSLSCAEYEAIAVSTMDSFITVDLVLSDLACESSNNTGITADVTCTGFLTASYGSENFEFDLSNKIFIATNPAGDWLMCGEK